MLKCANDLAAVRKLEPDWNLLADGMGQPLLRHEWFLSAIEAFGIERDLRVWTLESDGKVRAIAPLLATSHAGVRRLALIGAAQLYEPGDFLYRDAASAAELLRGIAAAGVPLLLGRIPASSPLTDALAALPGGFAGSPLPAAAAVYVPLRGSWDEYLSNMSSQRRYDLRRAAKRAGAGVATRVVAPAPVEVDAVFDRACDIEARGWKGQRGSALKHNAPLRDFFRRYAHRAAALGMLRVAWLDVGPDTCAMQIMIEAHRRLWVLKIGYDEAHARCSPGMLLTEAALRYAFERQLEAYEFLGFPEPWLEMWSRDAHPHVALLQYPMSAGGALALAVDSAGALRRRLRALLPTSA